MKRICASQVGNVERSTDSQSVRTKDDPFTRARIEKACSRQTRSTPGMIGRGGLCHPPLMPSRRRADFPTSLTEIDDAASFRPQEPSLPTTVFRGRQAPVRSRQGAASGARATCSADEMASEDDSHSCHCSCNSSRLETP